MWTGVDCDGGPTAASVEDLLSFWVSSTELVEDTDMGSHQAVGAGEPKVMAFLPICGRALSSVSSPLLMLTGFGPWEAIVD